MKEMDCEEIVEFDYEEVVKATRGFSPSRLIGKGSHGAVYQGFLQDNKVVAVKRSSINGVEARLDNLKKLDNEISVLSSLRESSHIISFLGVSHDLAKDDKLLVMELMPNGSLHDLLHVAATPPPWPKRVEIAMQIARAVQFLHEGKPLVIHRDIKSANILFDSSWTAKLADFGLAVLPDDSLSQATQPAGTLGYLDPSYTAPDKLSTKNDVFSLGVVFLEIISGRKVIDVSKAPASIVEWAIPLVEKQRLTGICDPRVPFPTYMEGVIRRILSVTSRCLSENEARRPSIGEIVMAMETCSIERVRTNYITAWTSILQNLILITRRRRKLMGQCRAVCATTQEGDGNSDVSRGKMLLKEILADVTLK
ncbi:PREDICTED: serine/threonine-protein kinase-like protein At5g23170 [Theobroma cacao]|uniref:non-specific serine/threonine protein kinase n=1 Tax=Theobroma cacao TaxID=3641 RepID=A0AB32VHV7_THECC|nr:PREDICTED: serine/threonine-protein kinase-like protein At5g23170 [Theobroma cacao]